MNIWKFSAVVTALLFSTSASAISVGSFGVLDNWVTGASRISGTGGNYAGVDAIDGLIGDDLTDGAININTGDAFQLDFSGGIQNISGADLVIFDSRFSSDGVYVEINGSEQLVEAGSFTDSGLDLVLKNSGLSFDLFGASLDLSDWGITDGASIFSLNIRGTGQSDIMGASGISTSAVPVPAAVWLFGSGLIGLFSLGRNRRV